MIQTHSAHIFLDANTALHFRRPDQIDWCALTGSSRVVLIGAPILHRELEQQKTHNASRKLRQRADAYIKWLVQFVRDPTLEVRPGTTWRFIPVEPLIDFLAHNLSPAIADDQLIGSIVTYTPPDDAQMYVATADIGMEIKLRHRQIAPLLLPDTAKLPEDPDPQEKELQGLRRQLAERRSPILALVTEMAGDRHQMRIGRQAAVPSAKTLQQVRHEHQPLVKPGTRQPPKKGQSIPGLYQLEAAAAAFSSTLLSPERVSYYNQKLDIFLAQYEGYLDKLLEWEEQAALTIQVELTLSNAGTAPGSDIDVILRFPDDIILINEDNLPAQPNQPEPPLRPDRIAATGGFPMLGDRDISNLLRSPHTNFSAPNINSSASVKPGEHQANYWLRNLKHGFTEKLDAIYFRFPDRKSVRQFHVEYEISVAELPGPTIGNLHFVFDEEGTR